LTILFHYKLPVVEVRYKMVKYMLKADSVLAYRLEVVVLKALNKLPIVKIVADISTIIAEIPLGI